MFINSIERSDVFEKDGLNLKVRWPISPIIATLGGKIEVPSPSGMFKVKVQPGTASGHIIREAGKGIKAKSGIGDLLIELYIEPLTNLSDE